MNRSYLVAGLFAIALGAYVALTFSIVGADGRGAENEPGQPGASATAERESAIVAVRVLDSRAERREREIVVRGRTAVERKVEIKSEVQARIVELPAAKGSVVKKGQIIARLAMDDRKERLEEAKAMMRLREVELRAGQELAAKGYRPANRLKENEALYDAARAMVARMEMEISKTEIVAPFDAVVEERAAEIGAFLKVGDPLATLVARDPFLVIGQVSERDIAEVKLGNEGRALLATGEEVKGRVRFIATTAEPATRTFRVELEVPNRDGTLRDGITTEMRLPVQSVMAHRLSPQALTLNDKGQVGLRIVGEDGRVAFREAEILSEGLDGVWLSGLPERILVIVVGQDFVKEGQIVKAVPVGQPQG